MARFDSGQLCLIPMQICLLQSWLLRSMDEMRVRLEAKKAELLAIQRAQEQQADGKAEHEKINEDSMEQQHNVEEASYYLLDNMHNRHQHRRQVNEEGVCSPSLEDEEHQHNEPYKLEHEERGGAESTSSDSDPGSAVASAPSVFLNWLPCECLDWHCISGVCVRDIKCLIRDVKCLMLFNLFGWHTLPAGHDVSANVCYKEGRQRGLPTNEQLHAAKHGGQNQPQTNQTQQQPERGRQHGPQCHQQEQQSQRAHNTAAALFEQQQQQQWRQQSQQQSQRNTEQDAGGSLMTEKYETISPAAAALERAVQDSFEELDSIGSSLNRATPERPMKHEWNFSDQAQSTKQQQQQQQQRRQRRRLSRNDIGIEQVCSIDIENADDASDETDDSSERLFNDAARMVAASHNRCTESDHCYLPAWCGEENGCEEEAQQKAKQAQSDKSAGGNSTGVKAKGNSMGTNNSSSAKKAPSARLVSNYMHNTNRHRRQADQFLTPVGGGSRDVSGLTGSAGSDTTFSGRGGNRSCAWPDQFSASAPPVESTAHVPSSSSETAAAAMLANSVPASKLSAHASTVAWRKDPLWALRPPRTIPRMTKAAQAANRARANLVRERTQANNIEAMAMMGSLSEVARLQISEASSSSSRRGDGVVLDDPRHISSIRIERLS